MRQIFMCVLSLSLSGALTGLLILLIRPVTERYLSKKWNYYIWLLLVARLLLPIYFDNGYPGALIKSRSLESQSKAGTDDIGEKQGLAQDSISEKSPQASVPNQAQTPPHRTRKQEQPQKETVKDTQASQKTTKDALEHQDDLQSTVFLRPQKTPKDKQEPTEDWNSGEGAQNPLPAISRKTLDWKFILEIIWLLGAGASLFLKRKDYQHFTNRMKKSCEPISDSRIYNMAENLAQKLHMKKSPAIYECMEVPGPVTTGLLHPIVVLPAGAQDSKKLQMVLHHELLHVKRKDLWYKWIYQVLLCIHWFNPILRFIGIKLNIDCELSCDEAVLATLTQEEKKAYGNVLIDAAQRNMDFQRKIPSTTLLEKKQDLKVRLQGILQYKKQSGFKTLISICLSIGIFLLAACANVQAELGAVPMGISRSSAADEHASFGDSAADEHASFGDFIYSLSDAYGSFWSGIGALMENPTAVGLDAFLNKPISVDRQGTAWKAYDDDGLIAGKDISAQWHMYNYWGGKKINCDGMFLNGTASVLIADAKKDMELQVHSTFSVKNGRFKIVHVNPDGEVAVVNETGETESFTVSMKAGRNVIKLVGQEAKIQNLKIEYPYMPENDFKALYYSEQQEITDMVAEEIKAGRADKDQVMELLYYLDDNVISQAFALLLSQGTALSDDEMEKLIIYSNSALSAHYLSEAVKEGKIKSLDGKVIMKIASYAGGNALKELLLALDGNLTDDTMLRCASYLDSNDLKEVLLAMDSPTPDLVRGCASYLGSSGLKEALLSMDSLTPDLVHGCASYLGSSGLKEVLLSIDDLTFDLLYECASYLGSSNLEAALKKYMESGNKLTYSQLNKLSPYLGESAIERLDSANP